MIDLDENIMNEVRRILRDHISGYEVRAYGSRVRGKSRKFSDLDLAVVDEKEIDSQKIEDLKEAFAVSDLPIMVDVLDWHSISDEFREVILEEYEVLQEGML